MTRIVVAGALAAVDMRQLEYACADALAQDRLPLEIDLRRVTATAHAPCLASITPLAFFSDADFVT